MKKSVLVVDVDPATTAILKNSIEKHQTDLTVLIAVDGRNALEKLDLCPVILGVICDHPPQVDGYALLEFINTHFPDIPVIFIAEQYTAGAEHRVLERGAVRFLEKPYSFDQLISEVQKAVHHQFEGGTLHNISSASFIQLVVMEKKNCTIRLTEKGSEKYGVLFIKDGVLLDARYKKLRSETAAYEIFSWDDVSLQVDNNCPLIKNKIQKDLNTILLEAMQLKDESADKHSEDSLRYGPVDGNASTNHVHPKPIVDAGQAKEMIRKTLGEKSAVEDVYQDSAWSNILALFSTIGAYINAGSFKVSYLATDQQKELFLLPYGSTVISVNHKCNRDHTMEKLLTIDKAPYPG